MSPQKGRRKADSVQPEVSTTATFTPRDCPYLGTRCATGRYLTTEDEYTSHMENRHNEKWTSSRL